MTEKTKGILLIEVVEDEKFLQDILAETLQKEGFKVTIAKDGSEGLQLALNDRPDLIVLDIILPVMDGLTMLKKLREDEKGKQIPVLVLTNRTEAGTISEALKSHAFDYLIKTDYEPKDIVQKIKQKLGVE